MSVAEFFHFVEFSARQRQFCFVLQEFGDMMADAMVSTPQQTKIKFDKGIRVEELQSRLESIMVDGGTNDLNAILKPVHERLTDSLSPSKCTKELAQTAWIWQKVLAVAANTKVPPGLSS